MIYILLFHAKRRSKLRWCVSNPVVFLDITKNFSMQYTDTF